MTCLGPLRPRVVERGQTHLDGLGILGQTRLDGLAILEALLAAVHGWDRKISPGGVSHYNLLKDDPPSAVPSSIFWFRNGDNNYPLESFNIAMDNH